MPERICVIAYALQPDRHINGEFLKAQFHRVARDMPTMTELVDASYIKFADTFNSMMSVYTAFLPRSRAVNDHGLPVLLLPGYGTNDDRMEATGAMLEKRGFRVFYLNFGRNEGPCDSYHRHIEASLDHIIALTGLKPALVGHSWGGLTACAVAADLPEKVSQVVTLGSPFVHNYADIGVPLTSIYTRSDGVVRDWHQCQLPTEKNPLFANIEVGGTHCRLPLNPDAQYAVVAALEDGMKYVKGSPNQAPMAISTAEPQRQLSYS